MRRIAISAALIGGVVVAARVLAPKLHARMMAACEEMFEQMPEDFPPKRMMGGIEEIRENTARTLALLEQRTEAAKTEAGADASAPKTHERELAHARPTGSAE
jgi:hypothetical protein